MKRFDHSFLGFLSKWNYFSRLGMQKLHETFYIFYKNYIHCSHKKIDLSYCITVSVESKLIFRASSLHLKEFLKIYWLPCHQIFRLFLSNLYGSCIFKIPLHWKYVEHLVIGHNNMAVKLMKVYQLYLEIYLYYV